jgi:thermitase
MIREYVVRGETKTVDEIDDVVAVQVTANDRGELAADPAAFGAEAPIDGTGMSSETADAFRTARWVFVEPSQTAVRAMAEPEAVTDADTAGKLVRKPNGRFGIVTKRLNVQLRADLTEADVELAMAEHGLRLLSRLDFAPNLFEADTTTHADSLEASVELSKDPRFTLAEPSLVEHVPGRFQPSDPRYGEQWQWSNSGQAGGTAGADVHAEAAWDRTKGAGIRVAVIDNGFNPNHDDLRTGVLAESGFYDATGANPPAFVQGTTGMPNSDHGTFCAGMVGARQNNSAGGCGAAPECGLLLVACLNDQVGTQTTLAKAVSYASAHADIIVSSLGPNVAGWDLTVTLDLALRFAASQRHGVAIFWAASNGDNVDVMQDEVVSHPDVVAVVRSTRRDLEDNAARGPEVELIAPGVDVFSTRGNGGYGTNTGTSFAAPAAAGCAALALAVNPSLTRDELRQIMRESADKIGGVAYDANGHNDDYGFGRVNAQRAVQLAESALGSRTTNSIALVRQTPGWNTIPVAFSNGDGTWNVTNGAAPQFVADWASVPGVRVVTGDFNGNGLTDIALVRQTPGWTTIPVAFANGDGTWNVTNGAAPQFVADWAHEPGVRLVAGDFNGNGLTDLALVRQTPGWNTIPIAFSNGDGTWNVTNGPAPQFVADWTSVPGVRLTPGTYK